MSFCSPCTLLKPISLCTDSIIIGKAPSANTHYKVNFRSLSTGAVFSYPVLSDADRYLTLDVEDGFDLATSTYYELTICLSTGSVSDKLTLLIGTTEATCFTFSATTAYDMHYAALVNFSEQTLEIDG